MSEVKKTKTPLPWGEKAERFEKKLQYWVLPLALIAAGVLGYAYYNSEIIPISPPPHTPTTESRTRVPENLEIKSHNLNLTAIAEITLISPADAKATLNAEATKIVWNTPTETPVAPTAVTTPQSESPLPTPVPTEVPTVVPQPVLLTATNTVITATSTEVFTNPPTHTTTATPIETSVPIFTATDTPVPPPLPNTSGNYQPTN